MCLWIATSCRFSGVQIAREPIVVGSRRFPTFGHLKLLQWHGDMTIFQSNWKDTTHVSDVSCIDISWYVFFFWLSLLKYHPNPPFHGDFWGILTTWMTWWMERFKVCNLACAWTGLDLKEPQGWESVIWIANRWNHMKRYIIQMDWHRKIRMLLLILLFDGCWIFCNSWSWFSMMKH